MMGKSVLCKIIGKREDRRTSKEMLWPNLLDKSYFKRKISEEMFIELSIEIVLLALP